MNKILTDTLFRTDTLYISQATLGEFWPTVVATIIGITTSIIGCIIFKHFYKKADPEGKGMLSKIKCAWQQYKEKSQEKEQEKFNRPYKINIKQIENLLRADKGFNVINGTNFKNNGRKIEINTLPNCLTITLERYIAPHEFIPEIEYVYDLIRLEDDVRDVIDTVNSLIKIDHFHYGGPNGQLYHPIVDCILTKTRAYAIRLDVAQTPGHSANYKLIIEIIGRTPPTNKK